MRKTLFAAIAILAVLSLSIPALANVSIYSAQSTQFHITPNIQNSPVGFPNTFGPKYPQTPGVPAQKLFDALMHDHPDVVKTVLSLHPNLIEARDNQGQTPLIANAFWNHLDLIPILFAHHPNVNAKSDVGNTALMQASSFGNIEIAKVLIAHNADLNLTDDFGKTALDQAKRMGQTDMVALLTSHGAK